LDSDGWIKTDAAGHAVPGHGTGRRAGGLQGNPAGRGGQPCVGRGEVTAAVPSPEMLEGEQRKGGSEERDPVPEPPTRRRRVVCPQRHCRRGTGALLAAVPCSGFMLGCREGSFCSESFGISQKEGWASRYVEWPDSAYLCFI